MSVKSAALVLAFFLSVPVDGLRNQKLKAKVLAAKNALTAETEKEAKAMAEKDESGKSDEDKMESAQPQIGMSLAVHPPKFHQAEQFLKEYAACPAAQDAMSVVVVFSNDRDANLFHTGLKERGEQMLQNYFDSVIVSPHERTSEQTYAAYKKWFGIAHMLDSGKPPKYGVMVDSELTLVNASDCGANSEWRNLLGRIEAKEASKEWFAAAVVGDGKHMDKLVTRGNFNWVNRATDNKCTYKECDEVESFIRKGLFSWWTDLPWMNMKVVAKMLPQIANKKVPEEARTYTDLVPDMQFSRFEHVGYQVWTVLHEGFHFKDVTDVVGNSSYGSYNEEDPEKHARVPELKPMWTLPRSDNSKDAPPLLNFHDDRFPRDRQPGDLDKRVKLRKDWRNYLTKMKVDLKDTAGPGKMSLVEIYEERF